MKNVHISAVDARSEVIVLRMHVWRIFGCLWSSLCQSGRCDLE